MTDDQILEIARTCAIFDGNSCYWERWEEQLLKFARAMYVKGNREGYAEGCIDTHMSYKLIQST